MKKRKNAKLALNRETVKVLQDSRVVGAALQVAPDPGTIIAFPTWPTCENSGCYICSGATCTMGCGSCGDAF